MDGWICPRCQASNAPSVTRCDCKAEQKIKLEVRPDAMDAVIQRIVRLSISEYDKRRR